MKTLKTVGMMLLVAACGAGAGVDASDDDGQNGNGDNGMMPPADKPPSDMPPSDDLGQKDTPPTLADEIEQDVVGSYVLQMRTASLLELPFLGETESITTTIGIATLSRDGDGFSLKESGCHVDSSAGSSVSTTIPDVVPQTTEATTSTVSFQRQNGQVIFERASSTSLVGVNLNDPDMEALPTTPDDPRVVDQDGDGKPGVTVMVSGLASGSLYVVRRERAGYYDGVLTMPGHLSGLIQATSEQVVLDASNPLLKQPMPVKPHPDPNASRITLRRVAEPYDCKRAVAEAPMLFAGG